MIRKIAYHIQSVRNWHCYILFVAMFPQPSLFEKPGTQSVIILPVHLTYVCTWACHKTIFTIMTRLSKSQNNWEARELGFQTRKELGIGLSYFKLVMIIKSYEGTRHEYFKPVPKGVILTVALWYWSHWHDMYHLGLNKRCKWPHCLVQQVVQTWRGGLLSNSILLWCWVQ